MRSSSTNFIPMSVAILTVSDTRTKDNDSSGQYLADAATKLGHRIADRKIVIDDVYQLRAVVSDWIATPDIHCVISTGGTGFTGRDSTPEALRPLFDTSIDGFGELFRAASYDDIGTSTVQSRACAGMANKTLIFCLPGSTGACQTGWNKILFEQLDSRHKPCNFVTHTNAALS